MRSNDEFDAKPDPNSDDGLAAHACWLSMSVLDHYLETDRVWTAVSGALAGRVKHSPRGFMSINCPMCISRGETADKRRRCGIKYDASGLGVNCYNCKFKSRFKTGDRLSRPMMDFMRAIGVPHDEVLRAVHWATNISNYVLNTPGAVEAMQVSGIPQFKSKSLPLNSKTLEAWADENCNDRNYLAALSYLYSRGNEITDAAEYYWCPDSHGNLLLNQRLIIPIRLEGKTIGWTARAIGNATPKYHKDTPENVLFNADALNTAKRKFVLIVEGVFDAIAIDGVGTMGAGLNSRQIAWINASDKIKIVVPDRDKAGGGLIDLAVKNKWSVAFPGVASPGLRHSTWWEDDVKDCAEACSRYGRLWTLRSILATATMQNTQISLMRSLFV